MKDRPLRLGWLSDIHLNFLDPDGLTRFFLDLAKNPVDAWLVSGDLGEAHSVALYLGLFETLIPAKTLFVLGNHDFYGSSLAEVRRSTEDRARASDKLVYLTATGPQPLGESVAVVGDDAWSDARFGDALDTRVLFNDFRLIRELTGHDRKTLVRILEREGDAAAARLAPKLAEAAAGRPRVVVVVHVPPFREAAWHEGAVSSDAFLPWLTCRAVGDAILDCARAHPGTRFTVLCGHTHGAGTFSPADNVTVMTAGAEYGEPGVQRILSFP